MHDVTQLLERAAADEPPMRLDADAMLAAGRRAQRRRTMGYTASMGVVGAAGVAVAFALVPGGTTTAPHPSTASAASRPAASTTPLPAAHGITAQSLPGLVERGLRVRLSDVDVSVLPPTHDIDLAAGVASARGQYINVQVTPAGTSSATAPSCADLEGNGVEGDGYSGHCSVVVQAHGGYLVQRSGRTSDGRYAIVQADLVAADGSEITAEVSNQRNVPGHHVIEHGVAVLPPVVSHDPPQTSAQLADLVLTLQTQR